MLIALKLSQLDKQARARLGSWSDRTVAASPREPHARTLSQKCRILAHTCINCAGFAEVTLPRSEAHCVSFGC